MRKFLIVSLCLLGVPNLSYAACNSGFGWYCFDSNVQAQSSLGNCKNLNCPEGCSEGIGGQNSHCCSKPTQTDCRANVYNEGCLVKAKIECLSTQYCDKNGKCQNKKEDLK